MRFLFIPHWRPNWLLFLSKLWPLYRTEQFIGQMGCINLFGITDLPKVDVILYSEKIACELDIGKFIISKAITESKTALRLLVWSRKKPSRSYLGQIMTIFEISSRVPPTAVSFIVAHYAGEQYIKRNKGRYCLMKVRNKKLLAPDNWNFRTRGMSVRPKDCKHLSTRGATIYKKEARVWDVFVKERST